uniref:Uncharacterized protein n=1 Tax=Phlebotomus papatasi TaxID=29031 RepID=A0A1B0GNC7_PHLPP
MSTILITIKTLQQQTFQIEFDVTQTVRQLKDKIEEERGKDYPADGQLLIYGGVMLENSRTVASYNVEERKFVVLMLQKQRPKDPTPNPSTATGSDVTTTDSTSAELTKEAAKMSIGHQSDASDVPIDDATAPGQQHQQQQQQPTPSDATSSSGSPLTAQQAAESRLLMGDEYNKMVDNLVEMGYSLSEVHKALQASYNNPERAVEYLVSGIPEDAAGVLEGSIGGADDETQGVSDLLKTMIFG